MRTITVKHVFNRIQYVITTYSGKKVSAKWREIAFIDGTHVRYYVLP